ncbi:MAG: mechanosensitive ion channel [Myxococcales bacterium]|nr:mechanosensitive ion channel [Myxococcales bacterium]
MSRTQTSSRIQRGAWWLVACTLFGASPALAQEDAPSASPPVLEAPSFVPVPQVAARSEELRATLRQMTEALTKGPKVASIEARLPEAQETLANEARETATLLAGSPSLDQLSDRERAWSNREGELSLWRETLAKRAAEVEAELDSFQLQSDLWDETLVQARASQAPADVVSAIRANLTAIASTKKLVTSFRGDLLSLLNSVAQEELRASESKSAVVSAKAAMRARILEPDGEPLWTALEQSESAASMAESVRAEIAAESAELSTLTLSERGSALPLAIGFVLTLCAALVVRVRLRRRHPDGLLAGSAMVFERPYSIAALGAFLAGALAFPFAPAFAIELGGVVLILPVLRVLIPLVHAAFKPILYIIAAFYLTDRVRDFIDGAAVLERCVFLLQTVAGAAITLWLLRPSRLGSFPADGERPPSWLPPILRLSALLLVVSAAANLFGYTALSRVLGEGVLRTAYLTVLFYAAFRIGLTILVVMFSSARGQRSKLIAGRRPALLRGSRGLLAAGLGVVWLSSVLQSFGVYAQVVSMISGTLGAQLTLGTLAISLGDVLAFGVTIALAVLLSRAIRILLSDDVLPRLPLERGVANAVSTTGYYVVLLGGFFLALGAAGVDFSRFTLLAGAFGVGIGFGLQNVVNNFVSGLILLYERPIEVGDTIEIGGLLGDVKQIGIRASTVRTFQGAEVIVPNGNLISAEVVNWTLSDRHRRVELPVGVAYGNRPARVIEVLEPVFEGEPRILREPAPVILFRGFGDSSLDFEVRFWARDADTYLQLTSDVATAIYDLLNEAGIEIPFPQRDLHLKGVDPSFVAGPPETR